MKKILSVIICIAVLISVSIPAFAVENVNPTTWSATDGLGRNLTVSDSSSEKKQDKFVGMFYWTWHYNWAGDQIPRNVTEILRKNPEAINDFNHPAWGNAPSGTPHFWNEPLLGYYTNLDHYVLRKHAELLADADVDVIIFDTTNGDFLWEPAYEELFKVWEEAKADGVKVPQVSFLLNFFEKENTRKEILYLYDNVYSKGRYQDLWFYWDKKPLLVGDVASLDLKQEKDKEAFDFFTFRKDEPTYFAKDTSSLQNVWGWCSSYPQTKFGKDIFGNVEQMTVSVAQNANENGLNAMNCPEGTVQGRSFAYGDYSYSYTYGGKTITVDKNIENSKFYGLNFQQQWDEAIRVNPDFIFVTGFNEWIAGRFDEWIGTPNAFPDEFNDEYSRDIEPSKGDLKDYYYYQLVENIRRYKGQDLRPVTDAEKTIDINSSPSQWDSVLPEYNHYTNSTYNRDSDGWAGTHYTNNTMRNDIVSSKVAYDKNNIYFCVKTADKLTSPSDNAWMRLLIDTDTTGISSNWEGFEYIINRNSPEGNSVTVERSTGGWNFEKVCDGQFSVDGNTLQIAVPKSALGFEENDDVVFNFKWSDNMQKDGDILDFYENGDVAPGGRFTFTFDSTEVTPKTPSILKDIMAKIKLYISDLFAPVVDRWNYFVKILNNIR